MWTPLGRFWFPEGADNFKTSKLSRAAPYNTFPATILHRPPWRGYLVWPGEAIDAETRLSSAVQNSGSGKAHSPSAAVATNAVTNRADIAKVQEWLGHANVSTTGLYDRRKNRPEDSSAFHVKYRK